MKKYKVEISETAQQDLENIISYLRYNLAGDIIADKYKILFKQELKDLEMKNAQFKAKVDFDNNEKNFRDNRNNYFRLNLKINLY